MTLSLIVAMSENRVIGANQKLPWNISEDLKRFKKITMGHPVIMGRKTFDSIGRPLAGRTNIVVTRNKQFRPDGVVTASSLEEALSRYHKSDEEVFILGGGEIFAQTLARADRIYLTLVHAKVDGDVLFPEFDVSLFKEAGREDRGGEPAFSFVDLVRK